MKILVTGASGFIGSAMVRKLVKFETQYDAIVALVRDSDQRNYERINDYDCNRAMDSGRLRIVHGDLLQDISGVTEGCHTVVNFAAKTYVDHSIKDPWPFIESNVIGTYRLLEDARRNGVKKYLQVSTDEVYGAILEGAYDEEARINPTNPYAATKAGADALVISYAHTFGMWTAITRTENNVGPFQHPQKVFPTFVRKALIGEPLPIYGDGKHKRMWLWVDDHVDAILRLLNVPSKLCGEVFHVAGSQELENVELARRILDRLDKTQPELSKGKSFEDRVKFIDDFNIRPGHDRRYALVCDKIKGLTGWAPSVNLEDCINRAVDWYVDNEWWSV